MDDSLEMFWPLSLFQETYPLPFIVAVPVTNQQIFTNLATVDVTV